MSLSTLIDGYLVDTEQKKNDTRMLSVAGNPDHIAKFYPSGIGYCARKLVYQNVFIVRGEISPVFARIMECGNSMHTRYEKWFEEMGILVVPELPIKDTELRISGRTDAIIRYPVGGGKSKLVIVELKSAKDSKFKRMAETGEPLPENIQQLQLYMHMTGIHNGVILVENKDTQALWEYWAEYDEELAGRLIEKIRVVNACNDQGTLPEKEYAKTSFECRYCDYREECWK